MHRPSRFSAPRTSRLRFETLEDRRLLSAIADGPAAALDGPPPLFQWEIVVNDLNDDRNEFFGLDPDYWSPVPLGKMTYTWSDTVLEDIAFCPWEDVSVDGTFGFYGVGYSGLSGVGTSYLYHFTIDPATPQQNPFPIVPDLEMIILSEPKSGATPGNPNDDKPVRLDAAEFDDRGMLHVAGHYDYDPADEPHTNLFEDWVFTIDVTKINPTDHHVVANPLQQLKVGTQQYHSAGDLDFDYYNKDLYVTTNEQKLLVVFMPRPQTPPIAARSGDLGHDDFQGLALDPPQVMWGFRKRPDSDGVRRAYQLHLGYGTSEPRDPIGDHPHLDDIMGAASIKTTAKADLCGAYFDVPPGPVNAGSCLTTSFTVQNIGGKHAGPFNVRFYLSTDASITGSDYEFAPLEEYPWNCEGGLEVRQTTSGPVTLCLPGAKDPFWQGSGTYYIGMLVDADDDVVELDENNNSNTGKGLDYDDLSVTVPAVSVTVNASSVKEGNRVMARLSRQSADLSSDLTVQLECSDAAEATVPSEWTIPANQASAPADFPIDAIRDWIVDGDKSVTITASVDDYVQGSDTVVVQDVDVAGASISRATVDVSEDGVTDTYQVSLTSKPEAEVEISLNPDGQVSIADPAGSTLVFTADNWDQPQVVTVAAVDDTDVECGHTGTITHTAESGDPDYDQITINDVTAVIADNDQQSLGRIDYLQLEDLDPSSGDLCYRCETTRQGFLTIEAIFDPDLGDVQLTLYDHQGSELATASPQGGHQRIDWPAGAAGETYYLKLSGTNHDVDLRLANLVRVSPDGYQVTVFGTQEHDEFQFDAHALSSAFAAVHQIAIKGVGYEFTFPLFPGMPAFFVTFDGGAGIDGATLTGSDGTDAATLYPTSGRMASSGHPSQDYEVQVSGVASLQAFGGGGDDEVDLHDSPGNDFFAAAKHFGEMSIPAEPFFYEPDLAANPDPGVGLNLVSWWNFGSDGPAIWEQAVVDLYEHGFRHVSLIPFRFVDPATGVVSTDPMPEKVPDVAHVAAGIHKAHELGMTVTVNPFVETPDFSPRGQLEFPNAAAAAQFFDDYEVFLVEVARAAADNGAHRMMIGSELSRLVQNPDYQEDWGRLIDAVAAEFTGQIGYAANWDNYTDPHLTATIWENPAIDFMGVDAYFQLANAQQADDSAAYPDEPFIGQIMDNREPGVSGWQQHVDEVLTFAAQRKGGSGMPLVFTEHGLIPYNRSTTMPFSDAPAATEPPDPAEQTNAYDALLRATNHLGGVLEEIQFWHWGMPGSEGSHWYTHPDAADHPDTTADESLGNRAGRFLSDYVSTAVPEPATLVLCARGFSDVYAEATAGGIDVVKFYDSPGNDLYVASPTYNEVSGDDFKNVARYFEGAHVYATAGGVDVAKFYDSPGDDVYVGKSTYAALYNDQYPGQYNESYFSRAKYFEGVHAYATGGGNDWAKFYDSPANDDFVATPTYAALYNTTYREEYTHGFYNRAKFFRRADAYATAAGSDLARMYDSPADDRFYADPLQAALYNDTYQQEYTSGFYNRAKFFEGVHAYATAAGWDVARLEGSEGNDKFHGDLEEAAMYLPGQYYNRGKYFEEVHADAFELQGDDDRAIEGMEEVEQWPGGGKFCDPGGVVCHWLHDFEFVNEQPTQSAPGEEPDDAKTGPLWSLDFLP